MFERNYLVNVGNNIVLQIPPYSLVMTICIETIVAEHC